MSKSREQIETEVLLAFLVYVKVLYSEESGAVVDKMITRFIKDRYNKKGIENA